MSRDPKRLAEPFGGSRKTPRCRGCKLWPPGAGRLSACRSSANLGRCAGAGGAPARGPGFPQLFHRLNPCPAWVRADLWIPGLLKPGLCASPAPFPAADQQLDPRGFHNLKPASAGFSTFPQALRVLLGSFSMSFVGSRSSGERQREDRNTITTGPPWGKRDRDRLVCRVRLLATTRARRLAIAPVGPMSDFAGYDGRDLVDHLAARYRQGCLVCGRDLVDGEPFEICHIDPLAAASDALTLARLMALDNIGLSHVACNQRLGSRPLR